MILSKYILREHIAPFIFGLSLIIFIFTMNLFFQMLNRIAGKGISTAVILEYFALNLAWIVALAVPMAVLIATVSAFGQLSANGEITALRATGVSPVRLMRPVLIAGFFIMIAIGLFNNYVLPELNHRTKVLLSDISRKKPTISINPGIFSFAIPKYVLRTAKIDQADGSMENILIFDNHEKGKNSTITSETGKLRFVEEEEQILLTLYAGEIHRPSSEESDVYEVTAFDSAIVRVRNPGMALRRGSSQYRGDRELSVVDMLTRVKKLKATGAKHDNRRIAAYLVEIHKKFSIPAACVVFVLLGTPLGMMAHKGGMGVAGAISLLFFMVYWAFLVNGEDLAERGLVTPAMGMWAPNILLTIVGVWLVWISKRRTSLPAVSWVGANLLRLFKRGTNIEDKQVTGT